MARKLRRNAKEEFTKFTVTLFADVKPQFDTVAHEVMPGYSQAIILTPAQASSNLASDSQYLAILSDYESYAISRIRQTFIPHAQSAGSRFEGGGNIAMGYDPRGPPTTLTVANYSVPKIGRWKFSKVRPNVDRVMSMAISLRKNCNELSEPFWLKAGGTPATYSANLGYLAFCWFKATQSNNMTDGNATYAGLMKTTFTVYLKNRLARS